MLNVAKLPVFDYSALRLRNAEFRQAFKSSATKEYSVYSTQGLPYPGKDIFNPNNEAVCRMPLACFARVDRFGHLCNQCCFKLLDTLQVITFWQLEWIVFCFVWGAVKRLWILWFWRKDRKVVTKSLKVWNCAGETGHEWSLSLLKSDHGLPQN